MSINDEIQRIWDAYVDDYMAHDAAACAAYYQPEGEIHSPFGPPVVGARAIRATHQDWFAEGETNKTITVLDARAEGTLAYCLSAYSADVPQTRGPAVTESGTSLNVLERQPGGGWKIRYTSLNALST